MLDTKYQYLVYHAPLPRVGEVAYNGIIMRYIAVLAGFVVVVAFGVSMLPESQFSYTINATSTSTPTAAHPSLPAPKPTPTPTLIHVSHLDTPEIVKGVYITENIFASPARMNSMLELANTTELNTMIIDVISDGEDLFIINKETAKARLSLLHENNIYLIARVVAFNDENGGWYDPASRERWDTIKDISVRAIEMGFDEINYDYIRYPGPGEPESLTPISERIPIVTSFFQFLKEQVRDITQRPISLDIFGSTFVYEERRIGQRMEEAIRYFDYIMPMPYPSHWADGTFGYDRPGRHPYEVVYEGLRVGWEKVIDDPQRLSQLRIWVQDFGLESVFPIRYLEYTPEMIHEQIYACYHNDCAGWVLWNPRNEYRAESLIIPQTPPNPHIPQTPISTSTASSTQ